MAIQRDLSKEQWAIGLFGKEKGRMPNTPEDWSKIHQTAYPEGIPDELRPKIATDVANVTTPVPSSGLTTNVDLAKGELDKARDAYRSMVAPEGAYRILQDALKTKIGADKMPIGESDIFKQAGVGGYGALSSSLSTRLKELTQDQAHIESFAKDLGGIYKTKYDLASKDYQSALDLYKTEADRLDKLDQLLITKQAQRELAILQGEINKVENERKFEHDKILKGMDSGTYSTLFPQQNIDIDESFEEYLEKKEVEEGMSFGETKRKALRNEYDALQKQQKPTSGNWKVDLWAENIYNGVSKLSDITTREGINKTDVQKQMNRMRDSGYKPSFDTLTPGQQKMVDILRDDIKQNKSFQQFQDIQGQLINLKIGAKQANGAGDLMMINGFQRLNDPGVSVRQEEFKTVAEAQGFLRKKGMLPQKLAKGDMLWPEFRKELLKAGAELYNARLNNFISITGEGYIKQAKANNIPIEYLGIDFEQEPIEGEQEYNSSKLQKYVK